jgi:hypothetical protein
VNFRGYGATGFAGSRRGGILGFAAANWTDTSQGLYLTFETTAVGTTSNSERMRIDQSGNVGIGTTSPQHTLHVAGTIGAEQVIVSATGADYVFDPGYRLAPLREVAAYVNANHHLPGIPSAEEMKRDGVSVGEMQTKLLTKVEELTLHMIELEKQNQDLKDRLAHVEGETKSDR